MISRFEGITEKVKFLVHFWSWEVLGSICGPGADPGGKRERKRDAKKRALKKSCGYARVIPRKHREWGERSLKKSLSEGRG